MSISKHTLVKTMTGAFLAAMTGLNVMAQEPASITETHPDLRFVKAGNTVVFGIGIQASKVDSGLRIDKLMLNGQAMKAGLKKGDVITQIDGMPTQDQTLVYNMERIAHTNSYEVTLVYKKAGAGEDVTLKLDKGFVTPDRQYVDTAPPSIQPPAPPRVAYYTVVQPNTRLKIVAHPKSSFTATLHPGSCVFARMDKNLPAGYLDVFGETAQGQKFSGIVDKTSVKPGKPAGMLPYCVGTLSR